MEKKSLSRTKKISSGNVGSIISPIENNNNKMDNQKQQSDNTVPGLNEFVSILIGMSLLDQSQKEVLKLLEEDHDHKYWKELIEQAGEPE